MADQSVRCFFEDGFTAEGNLLVGADGVNSEVRHQFLPLAERIDTGMCAISAKLPFDDITKRDYLPAPISDSAVIVDKKPQGMFLAKHQLDSDQAVLTFFGLSAHRARTFLRTSRTCLPKVFFS